MSAVLRQGADAQAAVALLDRERARWLMSMSWVRLLDAVLHQIDEVGAAGEELGPRLAAPRPRPRPRASPARM